MEYDMKKISKRTCALLGFLIIFVSSPVLANCGSCQVETKSAISKRSNSLVTSIPATGGIEGFVIASCGMCNFGYKGGRGCSLTIKVEDTIYPVKGTNIHDHGDAHSAEGFCSSVRIAYVSGEVKESKFYSDSFTLIESPK